METKIYRQNKLTFIITEDRIYVKTALQEFFLEPRTHYWNRRTKLIKTMIELGEIRTLNELSSFCGSGNILWTINTKKIFPNEKVVIR